MSQKGDLSGETTVSRSLALAVGSAALPPAETGVLSTSLSTLARLRFHGCWYQIRMVLSIYGSCRHMTARQPVK
jgi:hypothetical protein